jgi:acyl-CoA synthetase (AMP-forming)/AMP-acid ligase II
MLHTLPLHHIHGLVNGVLCALHSGASLEFARFDSRRILRRLANGDVSVFMGVPTMYAHLLRVLRQMPEAERAECVRAAAALRLAVSGSAACPLPVLEEWRSLTGQVICFCLGSRHHASNACSFCMLPPSWQPLHCFGILRCRAPELCHHL